MSSLEFRAEPEHQMQKDGVFSKVTLWKMMSAAKVVDIIYRLPGCSGQAADAVSAHTQVKMEDAPTLLKKNSEVRTFGCVYRNTNGPNHGPAWKILWFLWKASVQSSSGRTTVGKTIWNVLSNYGWAKVFQLGMFICQPSKRTILIGVCGRYETGLQDRKHKFDLENSHERRWSGRTNTISLIMYGMHSKKSKVSDEIVTKYRDMFEARISTEAKEKLPIRASGTLDAETISSWFHDIGRSCKVMCGKILWIKLLNKCTKLQLHAWITMNLRK